MTRDLDDLPRRVADMGQRAVSGAFASFRPRDGRLLRSFRASEPRSWSDAQVARLVADHDLAGEVFASAHEAFAAGLTIGRRESEAEVEGVPGAHLSPLGRAVIWRRPIGAERARRGLK